MRFELEKRTPRGLDYFLEYKLQQGDMNHDVEICLS